MTVRNLVLGVVSTLSMFLKSSFLRSGSTFGHQCLSSGFRKELQTDDRPQTKMSSVWYEVVNPGVGLTQGDIILECPLLRWAIGDAVDAEPESSEERLYRSATAFKADVVVMTQACDLEQGKVADVVLCPCCTLSTYKKAWETAERAKSQNPTQRAWSVLCRDIKDGFIWNLFLMNCMREGDLACEHQIVDFHAIHTAPKVFLDAMLMERGAKRLRLLSPYREHLSQSFARYFMRVGLPTAVSQAW
jgi:hypothetical protein